MGDAAAPTRRSPASLARWPVVPVAVLFISGIVLHKSLPPSPGVWLGGSAGLLLAAWRLVRRPVARSALLAVPAVLAGVVTAQLYAFYYPRHHVSAYATDDPRLAQVELYLDDTPRVLTNPFDHRRAIPPKQVTTARVVRIKTWDGWVDATGDVLVQIAQPHPRLAAGQTIRAVGMLQRPAPAMNPGQFNWAK